MSLLITFGLVFCTTVLYAQGEPPENKLMAAAQDARTQGDLAKVITLYQQVLKEFPQCGNYQYARLYLANTYIDNRQYAEGIQVFEALMREQPEFIWTLNACYYGTLLKAYALTKEQQKAEGIWQGVARRMNPSPFQMWQYITAEDYAAQMAADPTGFAAKLDQITSLSQLPSGPEGLRAQMLWLYHQSQQHPKVFVEQAMLLLEVAQGASSVKDIYLPAAISTPALEMMLADGQFAKAKQLSQGLWDALAMMGNPNGWVDALIEPYFGILQKYPEAYAEQAQPYVELIQWGTNRQDVLFPVRMAGPLYAGLMRGGKMDQAREVHALVQGTLKTLNLADLAQADEDAYRMGLSQGAVSAMCLQLKRAMAAKDTASAKKWMTMLDALAPELPAVCEVRKVYRTFTENAGKGQ
jgi:tetratricopeptide (TPR) repeat protein